MSHGNILIIEDDQVLNKQLAELLCKEGFNTEQCHDGEQGLLIALKKKFDLILLDVLLPSLNGFSLLNQLRKVSQTPVMIMSACGAEKERIEGYSKGADDYLPKPFNLKELMLRIDVLLRRSKHSYKTSCEQNNQGERINIGELSINKASYCVVYAGQNVVLTPLQSRLLSYLASNQGQVLSKALLYRAVLNKSYSRYDRTVDMHISRIRKKLVDLGMPPDALSTVHGKGYVFK